MTRSKTVAAVVAFFVIVGFFGWAAPQAAPAHLGSSQREPDRPAAPPKTVRVLFVGDIMLDRDVAVAAQNNGVEYLFGSTTQLFAGADLRIANLEGTITTNPSIAQVHHDILAFTFDPALARNVLSFLNISAVTLANNHAYDWGAAGYAQTRDYLSQFGVPAFGHPYNNPAYISTTLQSNGKTICLIGYMQLFNPATSTVVSAIESMRQDCWKEVVFAHWGVEYSTTTTQSQRDAAHAFIDAGADMVVGAHPHVVEPIEMYEGKPIVYSLGNFMFDQDFSWGTEHGLALYADFSDGATTLEPVPLSLSQEHVSVATGDGRQRVLDLVGY